MIPACYLGLDLGTSSVKAVLMDAAQQVLGSASAPLDVHRPHPGWSEQDPDDWLTATDAVLTALRQQHPDAMATVRGLGLSGQMHGATLLDAQDRAIRPCILWNDTRSHAEAAMLDAQPRFRERTGTIVFPGFTAPKLAWVARHEPAAFAQLRSVLLPKDVVRLWLTGERVTDCSDAAGTAWLDVGARRWDAGLLAATGLDLSHMPRLVEGTEPSGELRHELAARWGLPRGVVVAGGAGDNAASAVGMGTVAPGTAFLSLGTSGVLFVSTADYRPNAASAVHTFCHALPGTWHQMGVLLSATDALNWHAALTGQTAAALIEELGDTLRPPTGVTFLPYLAGERTPHNDAAIRGAFVGLGHESDRRALTQAVLEGVAFACRDSLEALRVAGTAPARVTAVGGGARSRLWLQMMATVLGIPVDRPAAGETGAAFGAARLGYIAAEGADPLTVCVPPPTIETLHPDHAVHEAFEAGYARFRRLYPAIREGTA